VVLRQYFYYFSMLYTRFVSISSNKYSRRWALGWLINLHIFDFSIFYLP
jgi:hypothetical protein